MSYHQAAGESLLKPFGVTDHKSFVDPPALVAKVQGQI